MSKSVSFTISYLLALKCKNVALKGKTTLPKALSVAGF